MIKSETETTMSWISRVHAQALELTHTPCPVSDLDIILVITDGLPSTFETVVSSLDGLPFSKLTIPNVINRIMGHEAHIERMRNKRLDDPGAQAMVVHPSKRKKVVEKVVTCYRCGGKGHMASDCPSPHPLRHCPRFGSRTSRTGCEPEPHPRFRFGCGEMAILAEPAPEPEVREF
jgi:hypothetical protein